MQKTLSPKQKQQYKAKAHDLKPVVMLGQAGLTDNILVEVDRALETHELIKIKLAGTDRDERQNIAETICQQSDACLIQIIGKVLIIYRENPDKK